MDCPLSHSMIIYINRKQINIKTIMPRISKPDTHTGDDGTTSTIQGQRVYKDAPLIKAFGTLDELNSVIGLILACNNLPVSFANILRSTQNTLFHLGSDLDQTTETNNKPLQPHIEDKHITDLTILSPRYIQRWVHSKTSLTLGDPKQRLDYTWHALSAGGPNAML